MEQVSAIIAAIKGQISVAAVSEVLVAAIGVAIVLVFFWWGARKVTRVIMSAFKKGRLSV